ncbi:MAG: hypothetical protein ACPG7F_08820 [Aggregatilineales bacterium]
MSDANMQELLSEMTEVLFFDAGTTEFDLLIAQSDVPHHEVDKFIPLMVDLYDSFPEVIPAPEFSTRLKSELTGAQYYRLMWRLRRLPPRVHMAAFMALMGGALIIWRRRLPFGALTTSDNPDIEEVIA